MIDFYCLSLHEKDYLLLKKSLPNDILLIKLDSTKDLFQAFENDSLVQGFQVRIFFFFPSFLPLSVDTIKKLRDLLNISVFIVEKSWDFLDGKAIGSQHIDLIWEGTPPYHPEKINHLLALAEQRLLLVKEFCSSSSFCDGAKEDSGYFLDSEKDRLESFGKMISIIAHELGNPLSALKTTLQVLQRNEHVFSLQKRKDYLIRVMQEINRLDRIVRDYLSFTRPAPSRFEKVSLMSLFFELQKDLESLFEKHGIMLHVLPFPSDSSTVLGERGRLKQVFLNLLINAKEAIEERAKERGNIWIRVWWRGEDLIEVTIRDDGAGLSDSVEKEAFSAFYTTKGEGSGLGLTICRMLLNSLSGEITLTENISGVGCKAVILLKKA